MVVDDDAGFRRAARTLIGATAGFKAVGDASSGAEALRQADQLRPDLVLMDVYMRGMDGFEAARRLTDSHSECVVVLVSLEDLGALLAPAITSSGAVAFMLKEDLRRSTLRALWTVHGRRPPSED